MELKSYIMDEAAVNRALKRIAFEIAEKNKGVSRVCIVGIKRRGLPLAEKIADYIKQNENEAVPVGSADITMYRDDIAASQSLGRLNGTDIQFDITHKTVVLVDDVIYTGRTVRAAIDAVFACGRPSAIQLAVLIDRGHRELPIRPDYVGKNIPTSSSEIVKVCVPPFDRETSASIYE